ncbi:enhancer of mRNA-decapping protein 4 isoform X2 [Rhipicephalus microplus]|uniref:enhancer of mRNA-decapping protein 4 isoform X2 n=1 Tax=Rhipicephalus microplus TaxID=6941 RepID=UPI003F6B1801
MDTKSQESSLDQSEVTRLLKDILHVGETPASASDGTMTANDMDEGAGVYGDAFDGVTSDGSLLESLFHPKQQPHDTDPKLILLQEDEEDVSVDMCGTEVQVSVSCPRENDGSSNRVKIKNIVDYTWDLKYNYGKQISLHMSGTYLAYGLKAATSPVGVVRVLNLKTGDRLLIKGFRGHIRDMAFAHLATTVLLAIVDEFGILCVYEIHENTTILLLKVERPTDEVSSEYRRVIWCPYVPDDGARGGNSSQEDNFKFLVATNHEEAEVWNIGQVESRDGSRTLTVPQVRVGLQRIIEHTKPIIDAAFAPDGTALATAGADGQVRFFQVYMQDPDATPRCLHRWSPHGEKPVTCLFFLDNLKACDPDTQFWKFALTGTDRNTELKIWSCETWACLQTIRFVMSPEDVAPLPALKVEMDSSSCYLVASDIHRKVMYVGRVQQDTKAELVTLAAFPVALPVLNFTVVEAVRCKFKQTSDTELVNRLGAEPQDANAAKEDHSSEKLQEGTMVSLHWMTTKSIQACHIIYPTKAIFGNLSSAVSLSTLSQHSVVPGCTDHLSDISADADDDERAGKIGRNCDTPSNESKEDRDDDSTFAAVKLLLKPSDFVSPSSISTSFTPCTTAASTNTANGHSEAVRELSEPPQRKLSQGSTASSSSQEVADIMAPAERLANATNSSDEDDDDEDEELEPGLGYDFAAEDLTSTALPPAADDPSIVAVSTFKSQGLQDGAWPQPPDNTEVFHAVTTTAVCKHAKMDDTPHVEEKSAGHAVAELELLVSHLAEKTTTLSKAVNTLSSQFREHHAVLVKLQQAQLYWDEELSALSTETRSNLSSLGTLEAAVIRLSEIHKTGIDKQSSILAQSLATMLGSQLEKCIANEFKNAVVPTVTKVLETTRCDISRRLEMTETAIRDAIIKAVKSKMMADTVAQAINTSVQSDVQGTCREILQNTLIPSIERICQDLFLQLNEAFKRGTREFLHLSQQQIQKHGEARASETMKNIESNVNRALQTFLRDNRAALAPPDFRAPLDEVVTSAFSNLKIGLLQALAAQQEMLANSLREEMHGALQETVAAAASEGIGSHSSMKTPVPLADPYLVLHQITLLVRQGQYNMAFQQALSISDLATVVATCEMVSPAVVFGEHPCPLQQPVLLSLIQQLCADLATSTEIKLKYLEEAVLSLDKENVVTKEHVQVILTQLCQKVEMFLTGAPAHDKGRMAKRLLMVTQSCLAG